MKLINDYLDFNTAQFIYQLIKMFSAEHEQTTTLLRGLYDLHIHSEVDHDSRTPYSEMIQSAQEHGLNGIAITPHHKLDGIYNAVEMGESMGMVVIPGLELHAVDGGMKHIIALGIDPEYTLTKKIPENRSIEYLCKWVHETMGGFTFAAHPKNHPTATSFTYKGIQKYREWLNGIEGVNKVYNPTAVALGQELGLSVIGVSDAHRSWQVGIAATEIYAEENTWQSVVQAIAKNEPGTVNALVLRDFMSEAPLLTRILYRFMKFTL